jgi:peptidoglycan hydrolase-like protein with peptidoglycan-binding domain
MLRSKLRGDPLAESLLSAERHAELQEALAEKGFLRSDQVGSGTHDGEFGPVTRQAIKQFQQSLGAAPSGFLSGAPNARRFSKARQNVRPRLRG